MKIVAFVFLALMLCVAGVLGMSYVSAFNAGNRHEQAIKAAYTNNENILAQYGQKIQEAAQIPGMQRDDLVTIFTGSLEARYGADGSKAAFQFLQEQNPTLEQASYTQIQRMIEAGRNEFTAAQTSLIDRERAYETELGSFWRGTWLGVAGYPKINLDEFKIISTGRAQDAFRTGVEAPISLR
jgi:hypothetical protein